jgi:hypothetical protein
MTSSATRPWKADASKTPDRPAPALTPRGHPAVGSSEMVTVQRQVGNRAARSLLRKEQALVVTLITEGHKDGNRLTNAVFYSRHPELVGAALNRDPVLVREWLAIRDRLVRPALTMVRQPPGGPAGPEPEAPASRTHPASTTTTVEAGPAGSPAEAAPSDRGLSAVTDFLRAAYDAVTGWVSGDSEPTLTTPASITMPAQPPVALGGPAAESAMETAPPPSKPADVTKSEGEARFRIRQATVTGSTLDVAKTRADLGDAGTRYLRAGVPKEVAADILSGDTGAQVFWCSALSLWTLAAAGFDLGKTIVGADGKEFTYTELTGKKDKAGKPRYREVPITLKQLVDGEAKAVEAMSIAEAKGMVKSVEGELRLGPGGSVGELSHEGHSAGYAAEGTAAAVKGAAGAFALARIGREVPELEQKPGDFAQSRYATKGEGHDTEVRQRGWGHAWQIWAVRARGAAMFGQPGSPVPTNEGLKGWHTGVEFVMDKDTDPSLVGVHNVVKASRIEANKAGAGTLESTKKNPSADGGVQITREVTVPDVDAKKVDYAVFFGRLSTSPWANWKPASAPSPSEPDPGS